MCQSGHDCVSRFHTFSIYAASLNCAHLCRKEYTRYFSKLRYVHPEHINYYAPHLSSWHCDLKYNCSVYRMLFLAGDKRANNL